eukprot:g30853.t1
MADFLSEAHGRLTAQQQIELAEQLGLGKALFQEFRKELEAMIELFYSFDDTHSGVVKKVEVWVALSNLGLLPCLDQNKVEMLVMISLACTDAAANPAVARFSGQVPRTERGAWNSQRWLGTKAALKALLQSSEFLQLASQVGSLDEGCMDFARFLYLALEALHLGPKQREDQKKITEFLNDVNEFGFSPLTLDFEAFVRFVRQVKEWQAICTRAADRAYGADLGLQERMVDEFRVIFDIIDSSGSGELDLLGVKRACGLLGQKSLSFEELRKIFETLDKDGSATSNPHSEESPSENEADTHLALSAASALVHDNEVLAEQLRASDAALSAVLAEVQSLRAQAAQLPMAQNQTKHPERRSTRSLSMIQLKPELGKAIAALETPYTAAFEQQRMPGASGASETKSGCPYQDASLMPFEDLANGGDVTITSGRYVVSTSVALGRLTVDENAELVVGDNVEIQTQGILVKGVLRMGSSTCRLESLVVTFTGDGDQNARTEDDGRDDSGDTVVELLDEVDWQVGQQLVVVTSAWTDEPSQHQNEVRTIAAVDGARVTISEPLEFSHYGGPEYATEVALLSRSITFQGDEGSETTRYGGHVMCAPGSNCRIAGVRGYRVGQENVMGRYPFHFHMLGNVDQNTFFEDCTVQHSYFRAYTVHGTSFSRVSRNVAYDVSGSAYYLEDGVEENNLFEYNLAAFVHIIDRLSDYENGGGVTVQTVPTRIVPTDATAVGFYCTNAKNRWIGNSASGGFSGFHFPTVTKALGDSAASHPDYEPDQMELLEFDSNTAHSSGRVPTCSTTKGLFCGGLAQGND